MYSVFAASLFFAYNVRGTYTEENNFDNCIPHSTYLEGEWEEHHPEDYDATLCQIPDENNDLYVYPVDAEECVPEEGVEYTQEKVDADLVVEYEVRDVWWDKEKESIRAKGHYL